MSKSPRSGVGGKRLVWGKLQVLTLEGSLALSCQSVQWWMEPQCSETCLSFCFYVPGSDTTLAPWGPGLPLCSAQPAQPHKAGLHTSALQLSSLLVLCLPPFLSCPLNPSLLPTPRRGRKRLKPMCPLSTSHSPATLHFSNSLCYQSLGSERCGPFPCPRVGNEKGRGLGGAPSVLVATGLTWTVQATAKECQPGPEL